MEISLRLLPVCYKCKFCQFCQTPSFTFFINFRSIKPISLTIIYLMVCNLIRIPSRIIIIYNFTILIQVSSRITMNYSVYNTQILLFK